MVYVKAEKLEDLDQYKGKLKGAIVITSEPLPLPTPDEPAMNPVLVPYGDSFLLVRPLRPGEKPREFDPAFRVHDLCRRATNFSRKRECWRA